MNDPPTAHKMLAMRVSEPNILKDLRQILLAADKDIPSTRLATTKQRYITLCNQLGTVKLLGMSYPLFAEFNVVNFLKYWHMTYEADSSQATGSSSSSQ